MICEEKTETKHAQETSIVSMLRLALITAHQETFATHQDSADSSRDRELSLRIWQARSLWQTYDPIQAGRLLPK